MLNDRGFAEEKVKCPICLEYYMTSPSDPHDDGECPYCQEQNSIAGDQLNELLDSTVLDESESEPCYDNQ